MKGWKNEAVVGLPLYSREEYAKQQTASKQPYDFKDYDEWYEHCQKTKTQLEKLGLKVSFVGIVVSELDEWLKKNQLENSPQNVAKYVAIKLKEANT